MKSSISRTSLATTLLVLSAVGASAANGDLCRQLEARMSAPSQAPSRVAVQRRVNMLLQRAFDSGCDLYGGMQTYDHCRSYLDEIRRVSLAAEQHLTFDRHDLEEAYVSAGCDADPNTVLVGEEPAWSSEHVVRLEPAEPELAERIPVELAEVPIPMMRPQIEEAQAPVAIAAEPISPEPVRAASGQAAPVEAGPIPASRTQVRVVGWKFLPEADEEMNFEAIAKGEAGILTTAVQSAVTFLGIAPATAAEVAQPAEEGEKVAGLRD